MIGNAVLKGLKVAGQTIAGIVGFGLVAAGTGWKPGADAPAIVSVAWYAVGSAAVSGLGALLVRAGTYRAALDPNAKTPVQ